MINQDTVAAPVPSVMRSNNKASQSPLSLIMLASAMQQCYTKTAAIRVLAARTFVMPRTPGLYIAFALGMAFQYLLLELAIIRGDAFLFPASPAAVTMMSAAKGKGNEGDEGGNSGVGNGGNGRKRDIRWEGRSRNWEDVRNNLLETYEYCRMPGFVIEERPPIFLSKGITFGNGWRQKEKKVAIARGEEDRDEFMKKRTEEWRRRYLDNQWDGKGKAVGGDSHGNQQENEHNKDLSNLTKKITYIHVGKAGGSSSSCNVREAFPYIRKHCETKSFPAEGPLESAISRQVDCYVHYNYNTHCYDVNKSFIINTRNPVHRIMSWYLYEHLWNEPWNNPQRAKSSPRCGVFMVSICFGSLDELATVGLSGPPPPRDTRLRVGSDLTPKECSQWAWAAVRGDVPATYHNVWNYDWYASRILEDDSSEIFNLRVEHNDYDWRTIDRMVGGTGDPLPDGDNPKNVAADKEELPLTNKTVSEEGVRNLCRALCEEIQVYKRLLTRAVNLNEDDVRASMEELRKTCPEETDVAPRDCGQR